MSWQSIIQVALHAGLLAITVRPLGRYIAAVHGTRDHGMAPGDRVFRPVERVIYRVCGIDDRRAQRWSVPTSIPTSSCSTSDSEAWTARW